MRIIMSIALLVLIIGNVQAGTLVKYQKNTGDIIQTTKLDKMPSQDILNDRFRSQATDVIFVEGEVDITDQRVDINNKTIIDKSVQELNTIKQENEEKAIEEKLIKERMRKIAIDELRAEGRKFKHIKK